MTRLDQYKSLFRGREDIFALRWEKGKKAKPLNDKELGKHLRGTHFLGIYPLLRDETSWFIAADFDKENWADECQTLIRAGL